MYPDPSRLEGLLIANQVASRLPALPPCLLVLTSISHPIRGRRSLCLQPATVYQSEVSRGSRLPVRMHAHAQGARACKRVQQRGRGCGDGGWWVGADWAADSVLSEVEMGRCGATATPSPT